MTVSASDRRDPEALYNPTILADLKTEYTQARMLDNLALLPLQLSMSSDSVARVHGSIV